MWVGKFAWKNLKANNFILIIVYIILERSVTRTIFQDKFSVFFIPNRIKQIMNILGIHENSVGF